MLSSLVALVLLQQQAPVEKPFVEAPVLPPGTTRAVQEAFLNVEEALVKKDFESAAKLIKALPHRSVRIAVDTQGLDADAKVMAEAAIDKALDQWRIIDSRFRFERVSGTKGQVVIGFGRKLGESESGLPKGAVFLTSPSPDEPQVVATINLERGKPSVPVSAAEITNESLFALTQYFGIEQAMHTGGANGRTDQPGSQGFRIGQLEASICARMTACTDVLQSAIDKKKPLDMVARPQLTIESTNVVLPDAIQGSDVSFELQVTNNGNAPLVMRSEIDCSCLAPSVPSLIAPGKLGIVHVAVNSYDFVGKVRKSFRLYSNDPEIPMREINVAINVSPLYRAIRGSKNVLMMDDSGAAGTLYLEMAKHAPFKPTEVKVDGFQADAQITPWSGRLKDPDNGDEADRTGYKVTFHLDPTQIFGRVPFSVRVLTDSDNARFKVIRSTFEVQRGIVSLPGEIYLGEIPRAKTSAICYISRPGIPFKIRSVESDTPFVTASPVATESGEYRLDISVNGKAAGGDIRARIKVLTDDPKQPEVFVTVRGVVK